MLFENPVPPFAPEFEHVPFWYHHEDHHPYHPADVAAAMQPRTAVHEVHEEVQQVYDVHDPKPILQPAPRRSFELLSAAARPGLYAFQHPSPDFIAFHQQQHVPLPPHGFYPGASYGSDHWQPQFYDERASGSSSSDEYSPTALAHPLLHFPSGVHPHPSSAHPSPLGYEVGPLPYPPHIPGPGEHHEDLRGVPTHGWMDAGAMVGSLDVSTGMYYTANEHPRLRTVQACEKCRQRKAKCTGKKPACGRCASRGLQCEYAEEKKVRGTGRSKRRRGSDPAQKSSSSPAERRRASATSLPSPETNGSEFEGRRDSIISFASSHESTDSSASAQSASSDPQFAHHAAHMLFHDTPTMHTPLGTRSRPPPLDLGALSNTKRRAVHVDAADAGALPVFSNPWGHGPHSAPLALTPSLSPSARFSGLAEGELLYPSSPLSNEATSAESETFSGVPGPHTPHTLSPLMESAMFNYEQVHAPFPADAGETSCAAPKEQGVQWTHEEIGYPLGA